MNVQRIMIVALMMGALVSLGCSGSSSSGKVLAEVNGDKVTEGDLAFLGEINPRLQGQIASPAGKKRVLNNLIDQNLLYHEAVRQGINRKDTVKAKVDLYRRVIIAQELIDDAIGKAAKKYYDEHPEEFKRLELSHIMVKYASEEELKNKKAKKQELRSEKEALALANKLKKQLDDGEKFEDLAKEMSDDNSTKRKGGSFGRVAKNDRRLVTQGLEPLLEKAFTLNVGDVGGPIKTTKGYHLIVVTAGAEVDPYEADQDRLKFQVNQQARDELLARLKKEAKISYPEEEAAKKEAEQKKPDEVVKQEEKSEEETSETPEEEIKRAEKN